jgi:hypothetical protein
VDRPIKYVVYEDDIDEMEYYETRRGSSMHRRAEPVYYAPPPPVYMTRPYTKR